MVCMCTIAVWRKFFSKDFRSQMKDRGGFISCEPRARMVPIVPMKDRAIASVCDCVMTDTWIWNTLHSRRIQYPENEGGGRAC